MVKINRVQKDHVVCRAAFWSLAGIVRGCHNMGNEQANSQIERTTKTNV